MIWPSCFDGFGGCSGGCRLCVGVGVLIRPFYGGGRGKWHRLLRVYVQKQYCGGLCHPLGTWCVMHGRG